MNEVDELEILSREVNKMMEKQLTFYDEIIIPMIPDNVSNDIAGNILLSFIISSFSTILYSHLLLFKDPYVKLDMIIGDIKSKLMAELKNTYKRQSNYENRIIN